MFWAVDNSSAPLVKLLLTDSRIDPSANDQLAISSASFHGHPEIVKLLLADPRVDPSTHDQWPIRVASDNGRADVVKLLLDQRVDISGGLSLPSSPQMSALFSLRRSHRLTRLPADFDRTPDLRSVLSDIEKIEARRKALLDDYLLLSDLSHLCLEYVPDLFCHLDAPLSSLVDSINDNNNPNPFPRFSFGCLSTL
jgi:hypothetical protein